MHPKITDYWDETVRAVDAAARRFDSADTAERQTWIGQIETAVEQHVAALPDDQLVLAAYVAVDDLYKAACWIERWDGAIADYLEASAGTFMRLVGDRGYLLQYLVDNAWQDMTRPMELFPDWYQAAGLLYICPQAVVPMILEKDLNAPEWNPAQLASHYIDEARDVAGQVVHRCQRDQRHFAYLDTDSVEGSYTAGLAMQDAPNVLTVFRMEAPEPGSKTLVYFPLQFRGQFGQRLPGVDPAR